MKKGGGKQKGAQWERDVCRDLSLWVSDGERGDLFWRSAMSGGRATVRKGSEEDYSNQVGDVSAVGEAGHPFLDLFSVECKHLASLKLDSTIFGNTGKMDEIWVKPREEAVAADKRPFVVAKQNNRPPLLLICNDGYEVLYDWGLSLPAHVIFPMYGMNVLFYKETLQETVPKFE